MYLLMEYMEYGHWVVVVLASYIWDSGTGILYMGQWYWHHIYETVVLASYI